MVTTQDVLSQQFVQGSDVLDREWNPREGERERSKLAPTW